MKALLPDKPKRPIRHKGIVADAKALGVTRIHLWFVLEGKRHSPGLMGRYRALTRNRAK